MFGFCSVGIVWCQPDTSWTCNTTNRQMSKKYIMQDCIKRRGNANFFACSHKKCLISQVPTTTCKMCEILPLEGEGISYGQKHDKLRLKTITRKYWTVERMWWCYFRAICLYLFCCWSIRTSSWLGRKKKGQFLWLFMAQPWSFELRLFVPTQQQQQQQLGFLLHHDSRFSHLLFPSGPEKNIIPVRLDIIILLCSNMPNPPLKSGDWLHFFSSRRGNSIAIQ